MEDTLRGDADSKYSNEEDGVVAVVEKFMM